MKYLKKFDTHSDYETFKQSSGYVEPNVSACVNGNEVHFNGLSDAHQYVDLGLPSGTLWATENIKDVNGNELYFAWGETRGFTLEDVFRGNKSFSTTDYAFGECDFSDYPNYGMIKYNATDGKTSLEATDDAATSNWGSRWKMPTKDQCEELIENTTTTYPYTNVDGILGRLFTSKTNRNTLFLPYSGEIIDGNFYEGNGIYWSSSRADVCYAVSVLDGEMIPESGDRAAGHTIRPVRASN